MLIEQPVQQLEEREGARLGRGEEEQARTERVRPSPRRLRSVGGVACCFRLQAGVAHRPEVELDEGEQAASAAVAEVDERVGCERPLAPIRPEQLPRLPLPPELM